MIISDSRLVFENDSEFRILEIDGIFKIERKFIKKSKTGCLWWYKEVTEYYWGNVTTYGGECFRIPLYGTNVIIDTYKYLMPTFGKLEDAENALDKLINPTIPKYHYR